MEEADILGDRIAIINNGKLQCFGTMNFIQDLDSNLHGTCE